MAHAVQLGIEYEPQPPYDTGSPDRAPEAIVQLVSAAMAAEDEWLAARRGGGSSPTAS